MFTVKQNSEQITIAPTHCQDSFRIYQANKKTAQWIAHCAGNYDYICLI